jgi:LEA14-like dessication related protein
MSSTYETLKDEIIDCVYCHSQVNLYYINAHLKTSKRCKTFKEMYLLANPKVNENDFPLYINQLKKEIKYNNENISENDENDKK